MAKWEADSLVGQTLGQFQIKSELGRGGMAVVYKGYQPSLDRWVAIKTLPNEFAGNRDMVSRFHREAEAMVQLNHTNIVQIIDKGEDKGSYYFAMEFVEGPSLRDLLKREQLSSDLMFDILGQVADGLGYAHRKGIVHRDIKPANILWEESTSLAKVADFGIARLTQKPAEMITLTATNVGMGTMNYMAPEQKTDAAAVDHRADIYALGVMIYEMFTGRLPMGRFKMPSELNSVLPRKLDEIVTRCLEADPADRYETMELLKADLLQAREGTKSGTLVRSVRDAAERTLTAFKGGKGGGGVLAASCLGLLVAGGGTAAAVKVFYLDRRGPDISQGDGGGKTVALNGGGQTGAEGGTGAATAVRTPATAPTARRTAAPTARRTAAPTARRTAAPTTRRTAAPTARRTATTPTGARPRPTGARAPTAPARARTPAPPATAASPRKVTRSRAPTAGRRSRRARSRPAPSPRPRTRRSPSRACPTRSSRRSPPGDRPCATRSTRRATRPPSGAWGASWARRSSRRRRRSSPRSSAPTGSRPRGCRRPSTASCAGWPAPSTPAPRPWSLRPSKGAGAWGRERSRPSASSPRSCACPRVGGSNATWACSGACVGSRPRRPGRWPRRP